MLGSSGFQRIGGFLGDVGEGFGVEEAEKEKKVRTAVMRCRRMADDGICFLGVFGLSWYCERFLGLSTHLSQNTRLSFTLLSLDFVMLRA